MKQVFFKNDLQTIHVATFEDEIVLGMCYPSLKTLAFDKNMEIVCKDINPTKEANLSTFLNTLNERHLSTLSFDLIKALGKEGGSYKKSLGDTLAILEDLKNIKHGAILNETQPE